MVVELLVKPAYQNLNLIPLRPCLIMTAQRHSRSSATTAKIFPESLRLKAQCPTSYPFLGVTSTSVSECGSITIVATLVLSVVGMLQFPNTGAMSYRMENIVTTASISFVAK